MTNDPQLMTIAFLYNLYTPCRTKGYTQFKIKQFFVNNTSSEKLSTKIKKKRKIP